MLKKFNPEKTRYLKAINVGINLLFHTPKAHKKIEWSNVQRILVIDFTGIGDLVMLTSFLRILKNNAENATIDLLCAFYGEAVLGDQGLIGQFYKFDAQKYISSPRGFIKNRKKIKALLARINQTEYDVAIEPRGDLRFIFLLAFIHSNRKISYNYTGGEGILTDIVLPSESVKHLLEDKLFLLKEIGCVYSTEEQYPEFMNRFERNGERESVEEYNQPDNRPIVGIHPGAGNPIRMWPWYGELLETMYSENKEQLFFLFEGPGEKEAVDRVAKHALKAGADFRIIHKKLEEYKEMISICDVMICNDSGAAHISAAYGVPTIVIFGCNPPEFSCPVGKGKFSFLSLDLPCKPCLSDICLTGRLDCIYGIKVNDVKRAVEEIYQYGICKEE